MQHRLFGQFLDFIKSIFFNGLLIILPIALTVAVFTFFFRLLKSWLAPLYRLEPLYLQAIPHSEFILVLLLILITGAVFRFFFLQRFLHMIERIALKIPLLNPIYSGIKQLVQAFTVPDKLTFQKVVLVEFPRTGLYSVGFLTSEVPSAISPHPTKRYFKVFIPTTPNPTTGFLVAVEENEIISVDLSRQEAMSLIISGGIIQPERFAKK